jgi:hypothetical protein
MLLNTTTRARSIQSFNTYGLKLVDALYREVFFVIKKKWDTLYQGDDGASYPAHPEEKELSARIRQLKTDCYRGAERRLKTLGVFSSEKKKEFLCGRLSTAIRQIKEQNVEKMQEFIGSSSSSRMWSRCLCSARC